MIMTKDSEKMFKAFADFLSRKGIRPESKQEIGRYMEEFLQEYQGGSAFDRVKQKRRPTCSADYMELAFNAEEEKDALVYAKRALIMDKNNLDAEVMIAELSAENGEELLLEYRRLIKKAEKALADSGLWDEQYFGAYWGIYETRPYMKLRFAYADFLIQQGKRKLAINEYADLLRLCISDNLGVRYKLIHLYAFYEDELSAVRLYKEFEGHNNTMMLLPMVTLYYRLDDYASAARYLELLKKANPYTLKFFLEMSDDEMEDSVNQILQFGAYEHASIEEFVACMQENSYLYASTEGVIEWIIQNIEKGYR